MKALVYLQYRLFINGLKHIASSPKRLIPAVLIALWVLQAFGSMFLVTAFRADHHVRARALPTLLPGHIEIVWSAVFSLLTVVVISIVYSALSEGLLIFPAAFIDFLFPAPVSRRAVLAMKLLGDYARYGLYIALFMLFIAWQIYVVFGTGAGLAGWLSVVCLVAAAMNLTHTLHIVTTYGVRRLQLAAKVVKLATLGIVVSVAAAGLIHYQTTANGLGSLVSAVSRGPVRVLLLPVAWCTDVAMGPLMPGTPTGWELAALLALAIGSAVLLLMRPENFYEPSLAISARFARLREARRSGDWLTIRTEFRRGKRARTYESSPIPPFGTGAAAVLWKNLVTQMRTSPWGWVGLILLPFVAAAIAGTYVRDPEVQRYSPFVIIYVAWSLVSMGQAKTRADLRQADIMKAMPVRGSGIVASWVIEPWLALLFFVMICVLAIRLFLPGANTTHLTLVAAGCVAGGMSAIAAGTIIAVLYPDARDKLQQMIAGMLLMLLLGVVVAPTVIVAVVFTLLRIHLVLASLAIAIINAPIVWGAVSIAGTLFRRFDPTAD